MVTTGGQTTIQLKNEFKVGWEIVGKGLQIEKSAVDMQCLHIVDTQLLKVFKQGERQDY